MSMQRNIQLVQPGKHGLRVDSWSRFANVTITHTCVAKDVAHCFATQCNASTCHAMMHFQWWHIVQVSFRLCEGSPKQKWTLLCQMCSHGLHGAWTSPYCGTQANICIRLAQAFQESHFQDTFLTEKTEMISLTSPIHFFRMLQTLKLFLENIGAGRVVLQQNKHTYMNPNDITEQYTTKSNL